MLDPREERDQHQDDYEQDGHGQVQTNFEAPRGGVVVAVVTRGREGIGILRVEFLYVLVAQCAYRCLMLSSALSTPLPVLPEHEDTVSMPDPTLCSAPWVRCVATVARIERAQGRFGENLDNHRGCLVDRVILTRTGSRTSCSRAESHARYSARSQGSLIPATEAAN